MGSLLHALLVQCHTVILRVIFGTGIEGTLLLGCFSFRKILDPSNTTTVEIFSYLFVSADTIVISV
jgi:hypothetical protein